MERRTDGTSAGHEVRYPCLPACPRNLQSRLEGTRAHGSFGVCGEPVGSCVTTLTSAAVRKRRGRRVRSGRGAAGGLSRSRAKPALFLASLLVPVCCRHAPVTP